MFTNNNARKYPLIIITLFTIISCTVSKVPKPVGLLYKYQSNHEFLYKNKFDAYSARGFTKNQIENRTYPESVQPPITNKRGIVTITEKMSDVEVILLLPRDADFYNLLLQKKQLMKNLYTSVSGQHKPLNVSSSTTKFYSELDSKKVEIEQSKYVKKSKKIIVKN